MPVRAVAGGTVHSSSSSSSRAHTSRAITALKAASRCWCSSAPSGLRGLRQGRCSAAGTGFGGGALTDDPLLSAGDGVLPPPPKLGVLQPRSGWNATSLAFLGDAVWELYVRRHYFYPPTRVTQYYENTIAKVRAEAQEVYHGILLASDFLNEAERDVLRWGGNAKTATPDRFKGGNGLTYKHATALECLVGYMYLTDPPRLQSMMLHLGLGDSQ